METREILLKADKVSVVFERISDGKIRVTSTSWDDGWRGSTRSFLADTGSPLHILPFSGFPPLGK
jgi:hypothetical protein